MSWMSKNYHVAALGAGALVLVGLGYVSYSNAKEVEEGFGSQAPRKGTNTDVAGGPEVGGLLKTLTTPNPLVNQKVGGRPVDLFTSVNLYVRESDPETVIDILQEPPIHPPVENQWFVDNDVDITPVDALDRDKDGDGFTNLNEHDAKTDPSDDKSYGALITKLEVASVASDIWFLNFSGVIGQGNQFKLDFKKAGGQTQNNRISANDTVNPGDVFYKKGVAQGRFKLLKVEEREVDGRFGRTQRRFATIEDQLENKKGETFVLPYQISARNRLDFYKFDHTVSFSLNAIGEKDNVFEVKENETFALPHGGSEKSYKLIGVTRGDDKITPVSVTVEFGPSGARETRDIPVKK